MAKFFKEDALVIKSLRMSKNWGARKIVKFFDNKQLSLKSVSRLIHKVDASGMTERKKGSGSPRSACSARNSRLMSELINSQEDQPKMYKSPREIERSFGFFRSTVQRIVKEDLGLKACFSNILA